MTPGVSRCRLGHHGWMKHFEETHVAQDGTELFWQTWQPDGDPKAVICLVHGLGEHSSRYGEWVARFVDIGYAVMAMDKRGHGRSSGTRGDLRIPFAVSDVGELVGEAKRRFPDVPVFVYGHSLGGLISMTFVAEEQPDVAAIVVTAPALDSELREQKVKFTVEKIAKTGRSVLAFRVDRERARYDLPPLQEVDTEEISEILTHTGFFSSLNITP